METTTTATVAKERLLADAILDRLRHAKPGHCARVDYLTQGEAIAVCAQLRSLVDGSAYTVRVLSSAAPGTSGVAVTADEAIEIRNRKQAVFCLFVPRDSVDPAFSSLANAFEAIDGGALYTEALSRLRKQMSSEAASVVRAVFAQTRGAARVDSAQQLDFALAIAAMAEQGELDHAVLEVWRVGLIPDADPQFEARVKKNRDSVRKLSAPAKLQATAAERIQEIGVDTATATRLQQFFRARSMNDVIAWSRALRDTPDLTFDRWVFPEVEQSDLQRVIVTPFVNKTGQVEKYCKLTQPDGPLGALVAEYGAKRTLVVRWKTEPPRPRNVHRWRIEIIPAGGDADDVTADLPARDIPGKRGETPREEATLSLAEIALEEDETLDYAVCVRVTPLDAGRNEIHLRDERDDNGDYIGEVIGETIFGLSDEFFLVPTGEKTEEPTSREKRTTVPTLAFGRLEHLLTSRDDAIEEEQPQWASKDLEYFSLKLNKGKALTIGLSPLLLWLERDIMRNSRLGGCYVASVDEVAPLAKAALQPVTLQQTEGDAWQGFWSARELFFSRLRKNESRDVIEVADWTAELADTAITYAQRYRTLLDDLVTRGAPREELASALGVDSLLIQVADGVGAVEEAIVTLPTHPLRAAWMASYTQLLKRWEENIIVAGKQHRKRLCDVGVLRLVAPGNVPPFAFHPTATQPGAFVENLRFFHGVALPAQTADPQRRLDDLATLLAIGGDQIAAADISPERLAGHFTRFLDAHPYATPLAIALVNPDRGELFTAAISRLLQQRPAPQDDDTDESTAAAPALQVTAYVEQPERNGVPALERIRRLQVDRQPAQLTDTFVPALSVTLRDIAELRSVAPADAHLALVADLTHPVISTAAPEPETASTTGSFALHGLITRFISSLDTHTDDLIWRHQIVSAATVKVEQHPVAPRFTDALLKLHASLLTAQGRLHSGAEQERPMLDVALTPDHQRLLAELHARTNWVISLDRYFALEYYDSPHIAALQGLAQTYVLDYTPDFTEGLGYRLMVTTTWQEEISLLLGRAMEDLGMRVVESSVRQALSHLKTISGHLAMQALSSSSKSAEAVGLGVVIAWLTQQGRLKDAVLIPVNPHPELFTYSGGNTTQGERRCDLALIKLRRGIVEATFIEVKWRRGSAPLDDLAPDMLEQMTGTAETVGARFFDETRVDGALQRASLASVLRFYFDRARRYRLFDPAAESSFVEQLGRLERRELDFRPTCEGYIVSLDSEAHKPMLYPDAKITVLTAQDFTDMSDIDVHVRSDDNGVANNEPGELNGTASLGDVGAIGETPTDMAANARANIGAETDATTAESTHTAGEHIQQPKDQPASTSADDADATTGSSAATQEVVVALGEALGVPVDWRPGTIGSPHLFITGIPGQGKSWTTTRLLIELGRQSVPSLVMDFHGQFRDANGPYARAIHPTMLDAATGLPFSPFEFSPDIGASSWRENSYALAEIFGYVAGLGDIQQDVIYTAIRDAYKAHGLDQPDVSPNDNLPTLDEVLRRLERQEASRNTANVLARCRPLFEMDLFRPMPGADDLMTQARRGLVIDLHNLTIEAMQLAAGAFVLRKLYRDMFRWGPTQYLRLAIVLDEAHRLVKDATLPKIMKEGRKFGLVVIVASQGLADFNPEVPANIGTRIVFRTNYPDSRKIAGFLGARQGQNLASQIEQLPIGVAYVQTPEMRYGAQVQMFPPDAAIR